jgi:hypothetical protein
MGEHASVLGAGMAGLLAARARGSQILDELFPGFLTELIDNGCKVWDDGDSSKLLLSSPSKKPNRNARRHPSSMLQIADAWLRRDTGAAADMCAALEIHGARPYLIRILGGRAEIRERRAEDRPDAVLKGPASLFMQLLYQRTGPLVATLRGLRIVGGRRPWLALRLQSCFERP